MQKGFTKRVLYFFKPFWKYFAIVVGLMLIGQLIATVSPYLFGKGVDAITKGDARLTLYFLVIAFGISLINAGFLSWIRERTENKNLDQYIEKAFSVISLNKMLHFSIGQHINEHSGVKQSVVNKGQNALTQLMYNALYNILPALLQVLATLIILSVFDWRVGIASLFFAGLYMYVSYKRNIKYFPIIEEIRKKNLNQSKLQSELFRNSTLVITEAQEAATEANYATSYGEVVNFTSNVWQRYLNTFYLQKLIIIIGQYGSLGIGVYLILSGYHSAGMFVALYAWVTAIFGNLITIMNSQRQILFQVVEIKKYFQLLDIPPDIDSNFEGKKLSELKGEIEFKKVSFAYPYRQSAEQIENEEESEGNELEHTISNISFTIPAGAKVGFVGVSGSGKSTIVNLMRRYYDATEGEILIDGQPLKELDLHWLRSQIGNVEQKIDLFDRSIRDNILFGLPANVEVSDERLQKAIEDASLTDFIAKLKDHGLDTVIGEGGIKVSGGERQRIGIARALIKDPKILIFDEATSALDSINEKLIHDAINRSAAGRTTIIIAHRLSTVMDADIIFVVAEGKIVGQGTHAELEKKNKEYQKLIKNQILMA
jgi:ABC-type multidrug transport system fused ATPase/permease subunit